MRSYAVTDLEAITDVSRRTIADYVSKGLLHGPSHRGRGARYSQRDLDALQVIPRIRMLMRQEFPSLASVRDFLRRLSPSEIHQLARLTSELAFEIEVRRLRVLNRLKNLSPTAPPERIREALSKLTPEQVRGVDRGHFQVGSLVDLDWMTGDDKLPLDRARGHGAGTGHHRDPEGPLVPRDAWASFGDSTVEIRIEKEALLDRASHARITEAIRSFSTRLEEVLKAYG